MIKSNTYANLFASNNEGLSTVIQGAETQNDFVRLDLSVNNCELESIDLFNPTEIEKLIEDLIDNSNAKVAFGGYLEQRNIYRNSVHFGNENVDVELRDFHLGVDFWAKEGTEIVAPLDGIVHSFNDNNNKGDYGPTIILEHNVNGFQFCTLYGHLSMKSIENLKVGNKVSKGDTFCWLGGQEINGGYAPHLHLQVVLEMGEYSGDYPGVCSVSDLDYYKLNCPNPLLVLGL